MSAKTHLVLFNGFLLVLVAGLVREIIIEGHSWLWLVLAVLILVLFNWNQVNQLKARGKWK